MDNLIILHDGIDREGWLDARNSYNGKPIITATQAAAIVGSHPYAKMIDVWNEKTDPDYDREANRNKWLDERADLGVSREAEIIEWVTKDPLTGGPGAPFTPNVALVGTAEAVEKGHASTPDAFKRVGSKLVLLECKTTQQDWEGKGVPQHVIDQCLWQMYTTGATNVWIGVERYSWSKGVATFESRWLTKVLPWPSRLEYILKAVAWFEHCLAEGIAPESDIDLLTEIEIEFDDTAETIAQKKRDAEDFARIDADLAELHDLRESIKPQLARIAEIEESIKPYVKQFDGRRVWLVGSRMIAKLVRGNRVNYNQKALPEDMQRSITGWVESETVKIEPNPDYTPATPIESEINA